MSRMKLLVATMVALDVILIAIVGYSYITRDKVEPKIQFEASDVVYRDDMDYNELIDGVVAHDNNDGDITDRIVVEKILRDKVNSVVVVYYAVSDYSGNVAKASRQFPAEFPDEEIVQDIEETIDIADNSEVEAEILEDAMAEDDVEDITEGEPEEQTEEAAEVTEKSEDKEADKKEEKVDDKAQKEKEAEKKANEQAEKVEKPQPTGAPRIEVKAHEFKVPAGTKIAWTEVILGLHDDKDDYGYLFNNIVASKYDVNKKGDYPVSIYTVDSDKNVSNTVTIIVHVI